MTQRSLVYLACDCCGDPSEACNDVKESRRVSGYVRAQGLDLCPLCVDSREPCVDWLRQRIDHGFAPERVLRGWAKRA